MKNKNQITLWVSGIIQTIKWTSMCFVCLMTLSLGIFLGKRWSETNLNPANKTPIELGSNSKNLQPEKKQPQDPHSKKESSQKIHTQTNTTTTTTLSKSNPTKVKKDQDTKVTKKDELDSLKTPQIETSLHNNLPPKVKEAFFAKYTIQLGTYNQEKQAMSYLKDLKDQGIDAFYMSFINNNDQVFYRVSSGIYSDKILANNELQRILKTTSVKEASIKEIF